MNSTTADAHGQLHEPPDLGPTEPPAPPERPGLVGGVAALIATQLGCNPFWLRMAFVALTLAGGLGVVLYVGLWLILVIGARPSRRAVRFVGGGIVVLGTAYLLGRHQVDVLSGNRAVVVLLVGLALALWQPRPRYSPAITVSSRPTELSTPEPIRRREPRSVLGQSVLGLAVVTAAVGAVIDQLDGGRMHPEQWLGASAAVCGLGVLIGVVRGRARWLVVPAVVFAAAGYVGGAAAQRDIRIQDRGSEYVDVARAQDGRTAVSFGNVNLGIYGTPTAARRRDVAVLVGNVQIDVGSDDRPSIDLRWRIDHGSATIDGVAHPSTGSIHVGPAGAADVIVNVEIWRGDLTLWNQQAITPDPNPATIDGATAVPGITIPPGVPVPIGDTGSSTNVADGVAMTSDGVFVLGNGEAMIDAQDHVILGSTNVRADGVTEISTTYGTFLLLPRGLLLTPTNTIVDLSARRQSLPSAATSTTIAPSAATSTTIAPSAATSTPATSTTSTATTSPTGVATSTTDLQGG